MSKVKLVVHECYAGKRKSEEVFAAVFLSNAAANKKGCPSKEATHFVV